MFAGCPKGSSYRTRTTQAPWVAFRFRDSVGVFLVAKYTVDMEVETVFNDSARLITDA